jgi:EAL domain-containing protein (putative c-di-GMP-specific phosphodiesterase class I)
VGAEALLRWKHVKAGELPPLTVVGIAERTGLIGSLTFWVLNAALRQAAEWKGVGRTLRIAVNLATSTLTDRELPAVVDQCIRTWGVSPSDLTLEIAENAMIADAERSVAILTRLKALGVRLAIDDFGSGFSSLSHMRRFPLDELKIDRSFVSGVDTDPDNAAIVIAIIAMAHCLGLSVVAEGVETQAQHAFLKDKSCDECQGFLFAKPMPAEAFGKLLAGGAAKPAPEAAAKPTAPVEVKPAAPAKPTAPEAVKPAQPAAMRPAESAVVKPAEPPGAKPAEPVAAKPLKPAAAARPAEAAVTKTQPIKMLAQPAAKAKPAQPEATKPAEPAAKAKAATATNTLPPIDFTV